MQSYASPGRVITVTNSGPDAVAVRADQPYRLGNLVGVTSGPAAVGDDVNLCVEGVFEQMVDLANGVEAAEAGTPVLMNLATFALVVGLTDATDHVHFGVLAERMTRRRVALVKLMPATAAASATGGGDGGTGGGGGGSAPASYGATAALMYTYLSNLGSFIVVPYTSYFASSSAVAAPASADGRFDVLESGVFEVAVTGNFEMPVRNRVCLVATVFDPNGTVASSEAMGYQSSVDTRGYVGFISENGVLNVSCSGIVRAAVGQRIAVRMGLLQDPQLGHGLVAGDVRIPNLISVVRRVA